MRGARGTVGWGIALALAPLLAAGLWFGIIARADAQDSVPWKTLGAEGPAVETRDRPTTHPLLAPGREAFLRSDDGGESWQRVSEQEARGMALEVSPADPDPQSALVPIGAPAEDATNRSRVPRGIHHGGATRADPGVPIEPGVIDLAAGADGRDLFATTEQGHYRITLSQ